MTTWLRSLLVSCLLAAGVAAVVPTPAGAITGPPQVTALTITATTTTSISLSWQICAVTAAFPTRLIRLVNGRWLAPVRLGSSQFEADVACVAPSTCLVDVGDGNPFLLSNGKISRVPGATSLGSSSCVRSDFCAASVGGGVVTFNGTSIGNSVSTAGLPGPDPTVLDLSCVGPAFCAAVGREGASTGS